MLELRAESHTAAPPGGLSARRCNIPNALTALRLLAVPVVIVLFRQGHPLWAAAVFVAAMSTDCFDGWIARRFNQRTELGLYLDPAVDKIVILALFYELAWAGLMPFAVAHLFLARELLQNGLRAAAAAQGHVVGANWMGKTKAFFQTVLATAGLMTPAMAGHLSEGAYASLRGGFLAAAWLLLILTWTFFLVVIYRNRRLI